MKGTNPELLGGSVSCEIRAVASNRTLKISATMVTSVTPPPKGILCWPRYLLQQAPKLFMRFLLSEPIDIGTVNANIRQLAVAEMREFAPDGLLALPGLKEAGDRCEHGSILSPFA